MKADCTWHLPSSKHVNIWSIWYGKTANYMLWKLRGANYFVAFEICVLYGSHPLMRKLRNAEYIQVKICEKKYINRGLLLVAGGK